MPAPSKQPGILVSLILLPFQVIGGIFAVVVLLLFEMAVRDSLTRPRNSRRSSRTD